jgi:hypothetical protein
VLVRWLVIPCSLGLLLAGCGGGDSKSTPAPKAGGTQQIAGQWTGQLTQAGLPPFRVAVQVAAKRLRYRFEGGGVTSRGTLRPARTSEWSSIFQEAGVQVNAISHQASK